MHHAMFCMRRPTWRFSFARGKLLSIIILIPTIFYFKFQIFNLSLFWIPIYLPPNIILLLYRWIFKIISNHIFSTLLNHNGTQFYFKIIKLFIKIMNSKFRTSVRQKTRHATVRVLFVLRLVVQVVRNITQFKHLQIRKIKLKLPLINKKDTTIYYL